MLVISLYTSGEGNYVVFSTALDAVLSSAGWMFTTEKAGDVGNMGRSGGGTGEGERVA